MGDGYGSINWWGFSPALDLLESPVIQDEQIWLNKVVHKNMDKPSVNILIIGAGDPRHILKTLARRYRHTGCQINFYVIEARLELYARYFLLLAIALESQKRMGLQEKAELYLEIFGNLLVREQSMKYLTNMSDLFIKLVTDVDMLNKKLPLINIENLKFKERDFLEAIFKFWRLSDRSTFNGLASWDARIRQNLGVRYDAVPGVFDWDLQMKLVPRGAEVINGREYQRWRHYGQAFELRVADYDVSNRSLASSQLVRDAEGGKRAARGYWGDILSSPYLTWGIVSDRLELFKKSNNVFLNTSSHVAEHNILEVFHELLYQERYLVEDKSTTTQKTCIISEVAEETEDNMMKDEPVSLDFMQSEYESVSVENCRIHLLPINTLCDLHKKVKYQGLFDMVYFSNSMVHLLNDEGFAPLLTSQCCLIVESALYMAQLNDESVNNYVSKVNAMANGQGFETIGEINSLKNSHLYFIKKMT